MRTETFQADVDEARLKELQNGIAASRLPPDFYEGTQPQFGVTSEWMREAKSKWHDKYDWRAFEAKLNTFPQFIADVPYNNGTFKIHFIHLKSSKANNIPLLLLHGWPGALVEFLDVIKPLSEQGFDVVVPSMPGYAWSQKTPVDHHFGIEDCAKISDALMAGLGYSEYAVQGGDWGAPVARELAAKFSACKVIHTNFCPRLPAPEGYDASSASAFEKSGLERSQEFNRTGNAYALEHASRPSTISHALFASPIALLAWIGEKFQEWTDDTPNTEAILDFVTLWWLTDTYPYSIYLYRELYFSGGRFSAAHPDNQIKKPFAFSSFPCELMRYPKDWIAKTGNLLWYKEHDKGGHFAAFERPDQFVADVSEAVSTLWPKRNDHHARL